MLLSQYTHEIMLIRQPYVYFTETSDEVQIRTQLVFFFKLHRKSFVCKSSLRTSKTLNLETRHGIKLQFSN